MSTPPRYIWWFLAAWLLVQTVREAEFVYSIVHARYFDAREPEINP